MSLFPTTPMSIGPNYAKVYLSGQMSPENPAYEEMHRIYGPSKEGQRMQFAKEEDEHAKDGLEKKSIGIIRTIAVSEDLETGLNDLATVSQSEAEAVALAYTTGDSVVSSELENENGYLVWKVTVTFEGNSYEIAVDAGNAKVLWASSD